jgi:hypothetical protein
MSASRESSGIGIFSTGMVGAVVDLQLISEDGDDCIELVLWKEEVRVLCVT